MAVKISAAQRRAVSTIAHALTVSLMAKEVKGMEGFGKFWLNRQTPHSRALFEFFQEEMKRIPRKLAVEMKKEGYGPSP